MARIGTRIATLERNRPARGGDTLPLDLPPDLCARIAAARAAGIFPQALRTDELAAMVQAADVARGRR